MKRLFRSLTVFFFVGSVMFLSPYLSYAESVVDEGSAMVYIEPLQDLPDGTNATGWTALNYDTSQDAGKGDTDNGSSGWQTGTYGVGYGDTDDNTTINADDGSVYSVYTRAEFNVANVSEVVSMSLQVDYDDGFIAWINGVEVARSASMSGRTPTWNASSSAHEASLTNPPTYETFDISAFTGNLVNGRNVLAIAVWNQLPNSSDLTIIPKLNLFYSISTSPELIRYPYIQKATSNSVTVVWNTDVASDSQVEYGSTQSYGSVVYDTSLVNQHVVTITGLSPGTTYYYRVSSNGTVLTSSGTVFKTNNDETQPAFTFVVFGDSGEASPAQSEVAQLINSINPELLVHTGDVVYWSGEAENYNPNYFIPYKDTIKRVSLYPTLGNHDIITSNGQPYLDAFVLPSVESGSGTERHYSFDYANAHFVSLDVVSSDFTAGSAQYKWLVNDLSATTKPWKFIFFHKPAYSSNTKSDHGNNTIIQDNLSPLFEQYGVDMAFSGHSHNYERTWPIKGGGVSADGVTYVVTGGGGGSLENPANLTIGNWWTTYLESTYHISKININGNILLLEAVKPDGTVFDTYTTAKYTLLITRGGTGGGTVTSSPVGINCGTDCSEAYVSGKVITLTATPDTGSVFAGWGGDVDCSDGVVTMDVSKTCTATFNSSLSISGTISYSGTRTGIVYVLAYTNPRFFGTPAYSTTIAAPGSYTISSVASGTYYILSYRDSNGDGKRGPFEAYGLYGSPGFPTPVAVSGSSVTGINITLYDPGAISGTISYTGSATGTIYIDAYTNSIFIGPPAYRAMIPAPGTYRIIGMLPWTYYVRSYRDTNGNRRWDIGEPVGYYGAPTGVVVNAGSATTGINITLY